MISVCIATYNGEKYIKEQLVSILKQIGDGDEVIVSDDHSTDTTVKIIESFNDKRIVIIKNERKGLISNFENAISNSKGDFIFLSDQDDIWAKDKVQICLEDFNHGYDLILSDCKMFDSDTKEIIQESFFEFNDSKKGIINNLKRNSYIGCCMAFSARLKHKALPFPKSIPMHDSWIGFLGEIYYEVKFNDNKLINYRKHSLNASFTAEGESKYSFVKKIFFRFNIIFNLMRRILFN